jgi:hypothetical protein
MPSIAAHFLPCGFSSIKLEHLLEASDLTFGFRSCASRTPREVFVLRGFRHLRQRAQDFLLGVVDVFQRIVEQLIELLRLFGHVVTLRWCGCHDKRRGFICVPAGTGMRAQKNEAAALRCRGLLIQR